MSAGADNQGSSTRPYLLRALHDWCTDNGFTPYIAVHVDAAVRVPPEYVNNGEIVLNVGFEATSGLQIGNEFIEFKARFGGVARDIVVPVDHVVAIYARENGQGMAFPRPTESADADGVVPAGAASTAVPRGLHLARSDAPADAPTPGDDASAPPTEPDPSGPGGGRPTLKRVK